jgi:hypothetical protein
MSNSCPVSALEPSTTMGGVWAVSRRCIGPSADCRTPSGTPRKILTRSIVHAPRIGGHGGPSPAARCGEKERNPPIIPLRSIVHAPRIGGHGGPSPAASGGGAATCSADGGPLPMGAGRNSAPLRGARRAYSCPPSGDTRPNVRTSVGGRKFRRKGSPKKNSPPSVDGRGFPPAFKGKGRDSRTHPYGMRPAIPPFAAQIIDAFPGQPYQTINI